MYYHVSFCPKDCFEEISDVVTLESILIRRHYITVTPTHTTPEVSSLPCTQLPPLNSSSVQNAAQPSRPNPGVVAAIALGAVLVILIMACAVAWVVCLKRKKVKLKRERSGRLHKHDYMFVHFPTGNGWYVQVV